MTEAERAIGTQEEQTPDERAAADHRAEAGEREAPGGESGAAARPEAEPEAESEAGARAAGATEDAAEDAAGGDSDSGPVAPSRGRRRIPLLLGIAAFAYVLDLVTKLIVVAEMEPDHTVIEVFGTVLQFEVVRNKGAAFGMGEALTVLLTGIAAVVIVVIGRLARKLYSTPWAIALGLLLGGAFGNLTDRIFRSPGVFQGAVVDFIAPTHFAVFNLADSAIVCGGILIVVLSFRGLDPDGTVHRD